MAPSNRNHEVDYAGTPPPVRTKPTTGDQRHEQEEFMSIRRLPLLLSTLFFSLSIFGETLPTPERIAPHSYAWIGPYGPPTKENQGFRMIELVNSLPL